MVRITLDLIRKRTEHHEGPLEDLVEIALHQYKIRKIETLNQVCPKLQILLLQNNKIRKIENLSRMRSLVYLNLAINRITRIENMESLESLQKLDLTLNYIHDYRDFATLSGLTRLSELYTLGNPCEAQPHFKEFLLVQLQSLTRLNGKDITRAERIEASRTLKIYKEEVQAATFAEDHPDWDAESQGSDYEENDANTKIKRAAKESARHYTDLRQVRRERIRGQRNTDGTPMQWNDLGQKYQLDELPESQELLLRIFLPPNLSTEYCQVDVQVDYLHIQVKENTMQLRLPRRIHTDKSRVVRVTTTGVLKIYMPVFIEDGVITVVKKPQKQSGVVETVTDLKAKREEELKALEAEYKADLEREKNDAEAEPDDLPDLI